MQDGKTDFLWRVSPWRFTAYLRRPVFFSAVHKLEAPQLNVYTNVIQIKYAPARVAEQNIGTRVLPLCVCV